MDRWGGNLFEGYNWRIGAVNTATDYFFENIADCSTSATPGDGCANSRSTRTSWTARGGRPLIQLPMAGYVAKDAPVTHPFTCGFPTSRYPANTQQAGDPFDANCGNGIAADGVTPLASNPTDSGVAFNQADAGAWVADLVARYGRADAGGVPLYELGNEPGLWPATHRHVHPAATTYDELRDETVAWAGAVRDADPSAKVLAFSEWAWPNYFCSALDGAPNVACSSTVGAGNADRAAHGGKPLVNWLLEQVRVAGEGQGRRLIDYVDVHYYRQGGTTTDVTRSLWDPTYADPSWIADVIRLIPRMKEWVAQDFPGLGTAITEYNRSIPGQLVDKVFPPKRESSARR